MCAQISTHGIWDEIDVMLQSQFESKYLILHQPCSQQVIIGRFNNISSIFSRNLKIRKTLRIIHCTITENQWFDHGFTCFWVNFRLGVHAEGVRQFVRFFNNIVTQWFCLEMIFQARIDFSTIQILWLEFLFKVILTGPFVKFKLGSNSRRFYIFFEIF